LYDAQPSDFQEPGQSGWSGRDAVGNVHLIIGHQFKSTVEQSKHEVGFPRGGRPDNKDCVLIP
jgi:hypothetical protein